MSTYYVIYFYNVDRACRKHGRDEKCAKNFIQKHERKRQRGRPRYRWEDVKINLKEVV
jgi:hypothetical protein